MMHSEDTSTLEVSNFGPIVEGRVDLRPMTVFVGPSNTGKSYLAILIYAMHKFLGNDSHSRRWSRRFTRQDLGEVRQLSKASATAGVQWARDLLERMDSPPLRKQELDRAIVLPPQIVDLLRRGLESQGELLRNEICRCFGADASDLLRRGVTSDAHVTIRRALSNAPGGVSHRLALKAGQLKSQLGEEVNLNMRSAVANRRIRLAAERLIVTSESDGADRDSLYERRWRTERFFESLLDLSLPALVGEFDSPAYYLPADRTGVMHAHNVVVSALIESASMRGLRPTPRMPTLSGVLADFLEQLIEIDAIPDRRRESRKDRAVDIEKRILRGAVRIEKGEAGNHPRFVYQPEGWKNPLPLMRASSMVSELAPVVLFLRHWVASGNTLIVEEPESHLHPAMQVQLVRELAALVDSGTRVIVTTHSEWLVEELSNIVGRSALSDSHSYTLRPDQVGVWLFKPTKRPKGSMIEEVPLDESGFFAAGYDDVAASLHNDWAEISGGTAGSE